MRLARNLTNPASLIRGVILILMTLTFPLASTATEEFPSALFTLDPVCDPPPETDNWNDGIYASFYGEHFSKAIYGCLGNKLDSAGSYFVALPSTSDSRDCLDGRLTVKLDGSTAAFRVIEIKPHGEDGPVLEATVKDVGPWYCGDDPYWEGGVRPQSEDGVDGKGRHTNLAGIDLSYKLAMELGINGIGQVDWRFKMVDGEFVVSEEETVFR